MVRDIETSEKSIDAIRKNIEKAKADEDVMQKELDDKKKECIEDIRTLAGPGFETSEVRFYSEHDASNIDAIVSSSGMAKEADMIERVKQEAQNQSDVKEAELRNVSLEQLIAMREQALAQQQQQPTPQIPVGDFLDLSGLENYIGDQEDLPDGGMGTTM